MHMAASLCGLGTLLLHPAVQLCTQVSNDDVFDMVRSYSKFLLSEQKMDDIPQRYVPDAEGSAAPARVITSMAQWHSLFPDSAEHAESVAGEWL
jgi:hypothetical protein